MIYTDKVMDHFRNPRNVGSMKEANGLDLDGWDFKESNHDELHNH